VIVSESIDRVLPPCSSVHPGQNVPADGRVEAALEGLAWPSRQVAGLTFRTLLVWFDGTSTPPLPSAW